MCNLLRISHMHLLIWLMKSLVWEAPKRKGGRWKEKPSPGNARNQSV
ncbi:hypothetical protein LINPERPRIM_LOCUS30204 [Linum perenne]